MSIDFVNLLIMLGLSFLAVEGLMILLWMISVVNHRVSIVDLGWTLSFMITATICFIIGDGYIWRKWLVLITVSIWALRLTYYLIQRLSLEEEDPRYVLLLNRWSAPGEQSSFQNLHVLALFLLQGFIAVVLSIPFALMNDNAFFFFEPLEVFGLLVWMCGVVGESIADWQLYWFKKQAPPEAVCETGLWKYSRHPNYFFESVVWIGYAIMALSSPGGWLAIFAPILMICLLLKVSGVPLAEEEALRTKGDAYRDYQRRTSRFFPWFPSEK